MKVFRNFAFLVVVTGSMSIPALAAAACQPTWIADGACDAINNNAACNYDGGDCCPGTCLSGRTYPCGSSGYNCISGPLPYPPLCGNAQQNPPEECDDGNHLGGDGCSAMCELELCSAAPLPSCSVAGRAQLKSSEKTAGKEQLKLRWTKVADVTTQAAFGDPVGGTTQVAVCLYGDGGALLRSFVIDRAGDLCDGKPCWKATGSKGYVYKDKLGDVDGIAKVGFTSGAAGKGNASAGGRNNAAKGLVGLPTGVVAALSGNTQPAIQLVTTAGFCVGATMNEVKKDNGLEYEARKK